MTALHPEVRPAPSEQAPIDPRGPRFAAVITAVVLAGATLALGSPLGTALLVLQGAVFLVGATRGVTASPYAHVFRRWVRPRLAPPAELEDPRPPQFSQLVGAVFAGAALLALALGWTSVAVVAIAFAFGAAFLNAAFGFCLGCEFYLLGRRALARRRTS